MTNLALDHACANARCTEQARAGQLACRTCWFRLPKALRDRIWSTWRASDKRAHSECVLEARQFWATGATA